MSMNEITLLLADDHAMVRKGLQVFLSTQPDLRIVGEASDGQEAIDKTIALQPDIVLMDLNMPGLDGIEATKRLKTAHPGAKIIVLTSFSDQDHVLPAIRAGARGYLLKDIEPEDLVRAIRRVHGGQVELHAEAAGQLMDVLAAGGDPSESRHSSGGGASGDPIAGLTNRERDVLRLIATGKSNKEIGEALYITEKTVKTHVTHLLDKLELSDRTQAAIFAIKHGLDG